MREATNPRNGSKFLADWTLERITDWMEQQVRQLGWKFPPGVQARVRRRLDRPVGYATGELVHTITIFASGRWVHAFPDKDEP